MNPDLDAIRARHAAAEAWATVADFTGYAAHSDRGKLLAVAVAEVDRLRQSLAAIVDNDAEWDVRIHGSAQARTTLRALLGEVRSDG